MVTGLSFFQLHTISTPTRSECHTSPDVRFLSYPRWSRHHRGREKTPENKRSRVEVHRDPHLWSLLPTSRRETGGRNGRPTRTLRVGLTLRTEVPINTSGFWYDVPVSFPYDCPTRIKSHQNQDSLVTEVSA